MAEQQNALRQLLADLPAMRQDTNKGSELFRLGVNGGLDMVSARIRAMLAADGVTAAPNHYRHIGYAKYVPTTDAGSLLVCCGPDEPGAFRMFRNTDDPHSDGVSELDGGQQCKN